MTAEEKKDSYKPNWDGSYKWKQGGPGLTVDVNLIHLLCERFILDCKGNIEEHEYCWQRKLKMPNNTIHYQEEKKYGDSSMTSVTTKSQNKLTLCGLYQETFAANQ